MSTAVPPPAPVRPGGAADPEAVRAVIAAGRRPPPASAAAAVTAFAWRGVLKIRHVPEQLLDVTVTPVMFVVMFTYLFGGAIAGSTAAYLDFLLPGILVQSVLFTTVYSGVALNTDVTRGVVDRFRSLPVWRPAPLVGSVAGESARYLVAGVVTTAVGVLLGYRPDAGLPGVVAALAVVVVFASGLSWVFTAVGLVLRSPSAVLNGGFLVLFPVTFVSNVFVDPATLPSGLRAVVDANPVSALVTTVRALLAGDGTGQLPLVLAGAVALTAVFAPLTSALYRRG